MRPNWFIALPVIADWHPEAIGSVPSGVRVFHPDDLHITIAFLGGVGEASARRAWGAACAHAAPVGAATIAEVVPMGPRSRPSALSATLAAGDTPIRSYIGEHRARWLSLAGARPARHEPLPHCTLARPLRRATDAQRARAVSWARALQVEGLRVTIGGPALYTWSADRRRRLFQVIESVD